MRDVGGSEGAPVSVDTDLTGPDEAVGRGPIGVTSREVRGGRWSWLATWGPPAAVFVASIGVWYGVSYLLLDPRRRFLVPPPHDVIRVSFLDPYNLQELLDALWLSARVAETSGLGLGIAWAMATTSLR